MQHSFIYCRTIWKEANRTPIKFFLYFKLSNHDWQLFCCTLGFSLPHMSLTDAPGDNTTNMYESCLWRAVLSKRKKATVVSLRERKKGRCDRNVEHLGPLSLPSCWIWLISDELSAGMLHWKRLPLSPTGGTSHRCYYFNYLLHSCLLPPRLLYSEYSSLTALEILFSLVFCNTSLKLFDSSKCYYKTQPKALLVHLGAKLANSLKGLTQ